jgi:pilus assembly protein Flp/PilA
VKSFLSDDSGATAIEYGLIAGFISVFIVTGLMLVGPALGGLYDSIASRIVAALANVG